jgi:transketolase
MNVAKAALREDHVIRADASRLLAVDPADARRGGYVLADSAVPRIVLLVHDRETDIALCARDKLAARGVAARVVAMTSTAIFDRQGAAYRRRVLLEDVKRVAIEAGPTKGWWKYVGFDGAVVGLRPSEGDDHREASAARVADIALFLTSTEV